MNTKYIQKDNGKTLVEWRLDKWYEKVAFVIGALFTAYLALVMTVAFIFSAIGIF